MYGTHYVDLKKTSFGASVTAEELNMPALQQLDVCDVYGNAVTQSVVYSEFLSEH